MTAERWEKIKEIFDLAMACSALPERSRYLDQACSDDFDLRSEVDRLLAEFDRAEGFLDEPIARPSRALAPGSLLNGRYRIASLIGRGGMGEVYLAHDVLLRDNVALKTLRLGLAGDSRAFERFHREVQLARKITHPNVCRVFEAGLLDQEPGAAGSASGRRPLYFTMQLLEGETLSARIRAAGRLDAAEAFPLIVQMAEGLHAAHEAGVIHRDFKSANVILHGGRAVITDFGLAHLGRTAAHGDASSTAGATGLAGTIAYMSPEQLNGDPLTASSDLYSFGVVLYEMAVGRLPFDARNPVNSAVQRATGRITGLRTLVDGLDSRWETAIQRCLEIDPAKRPRSAGELAEVFRGTGWRLQRPYWTRRQWVRASAAAIAAVSAAGAAWYWSSRPYEPRPDAWPWYERGVSALRGMMYEAGRRALEKAVEIDPNFALAHAQLARAYSELDYSGRAKESMLRALAVAEDHRPDATARTVIKAIQHTLNWDLALAAPLYRGLERQAGPRDKPAYWVEIGWLAVKSRDHGLARESFTRASSLDRSNAGAALRLALVEARAGRIEEAFRHFDEAEASFHAASAPGGVTQTLYERAVVLSRLNRQKEAVPLIQRAAAESRAAGDLYHVIRLELALALSHLRQGRIDEAQSAAEDAMRLAFDNKMENTATIGLLDIGNAHLLKGEPAEAERRFQQALEIARRNAGDVNEARAMLSLGSLYVQTERPAEALDYVKRSLEYYRRVNFSQEIAQSLILMGGAYEITGHYPESKRQLLAAVKAADELNDGDQSAVARYYLASVLEQMGDYPSALRVSHEGVALARDSRGGLRAASGWLRVSRLSRLLGDTAGARSTLTLAQNWIREHPGGRNLLGARSALREGELSYEAGRYREAIAHARGAAATTDAALQREASMLDALARIRLGQQSARTDASRIIAESLRRPRIAEPAEFRLAVAEALAATGNASQAQELAREAIAFFEPREVWERVWRCYWVVETGRAGNAAGAVSTRQAFDRLRANWPAEAIATYSRRPFIKKRLEPWL